MSELALTDATPPIRRSNKPQAPADRPPSGRTKQALDLMVHDGLTDSEAAVKVGITLTAIRVAMQKRGVRAYLNEQREVSRARACARNIHRLVQIRDKAENMPAIQAIRALEQLGETDGASVGAMRAAPGLTIVVVQAAAAPTPAPTISATYTDSRALDETAP